MARSHAATAQLAGLHGCPPGLRCQPRRCLRPRPCHTTSQHSAHSARSLGRTVLLTRAAAHAVDDSAAKGSGGGVLQAGMIGGCQGGPSQLGGGACRGSRLQPGGRARGIACTVVPFQTCRGQAASHASSRPQAPARLALAGGVHCSTGCGRWRRRWRRRAPATAVVRAGPGAQPTHPRAPPAPAVHLDAIRAAA